MCSFPVISLPFIIVADALLLASRASPSVTAVQFSLPPSVQLTMITDVVPFLTSVASTVPLTFSQLFFTCNLYGGAAILAAGALADKRTIFSGACGAAIGTTIGFLLGFDVSNGMWGFNSALTAMALYPTFGMPLAGALASAGITALVQPLALIFFGSCGLPALSFSFCLSTIALLRFYQRWVIRK